MDSKQPNTFEEVKEETKRMITDEYFAARPAEDCANNLLTKASSFFNFLRSNFYLDKIMRMWRAYNGAYNTDVGFSHQINFTGEQGELLTLPINHFRNIAQHMYVMITANRPVMEARAINSDYKSLAQTILANSILEYYMREKGLEQAIKKAAEMSIVLGAAFIKMEWNATAGEAYDTDPDTGEKEIIYEGELEFTNLDPLNVVVDGTKESWNHDWVLTRTFKNKYNLAAKYPELAEEIRAVQSKTENKMYKLSTYSNDDTDDIPVYEFFHKRTEALPNGRYLLFLDGDIILLDTKLPYRQIPIFRIAPADIMGTPYGYTPMFDIFPIQEALNALYGSVMTNQNAFAVQNVFFPRGADLTVNSIEGGMNIIEGNAPPQPINLTETPAEVFKFIADLIQQAETISGVSSVSRGNPEASLKSGTALALVQSMSLQFMSGLQQSYVRLIEEIGTALINILKDYANTPKTIALVGKNNRTLLKEFTGESLNAINRVVVDVGNPLSKTIAGRVQMAEQMLQMKVVTNPQQYFQVLNTGRIDELFDNELSQLMLIKAENERLLEGEQVSALPMDKHSMHIQEHQSVMADPELRKNPELMANVMAHVNEHIDLLRNADPALLQMIGEQPLPPAPGMQQPQEQGQAPGGAPPQEALQESPMPDVMSPAMGQTAPQGELTGPGLENVPLPNLPEPPAPFQSLPVLAQDMSVPQ